MSVAVAHGLNWTLQGRVYGQQLPLPQNKQPLGCVCCCAHRLPPSLHCGAAAEGGRSYLRLPKEPAAELCMGLKPLLSKEQSAVPHMPLLHVHGTEEQLPPPVLPAASSVQD